MPIKVVIPGSSITATVPIKVTPSGISGLVGIILTTDPTGSNIVYQSTQKAFTSTAVVQNVAIPIIVPPAGGFFYVWVPVYLSGILVGVFSQETTLTAQGIEVGEIVWS